MNKQIRVFWRCNGGHYFSTPLCPWDGWGSADLRELYDATRRLVIKEVDPGLATLRAEGVSEQALRRAVVVEFGSENAVFDAISPDYYVVSGKEVKLSKAGLDFH